MLSLEIISHPKFNLLIVKIALLLIIRHAEKRASKLLLTVLTTQFNKGFSQEMAGEGGISL
jgi:hypothetical protein